MRATSTSMFRLMLLQSLLLSAKSTLTVCSTPATPGFMYQKDGATAPITFESTDPILLGPWEGALPHTSFNPPLTGFIPDLLPTLMDRSNVAKYQLYLYPTFGELLYRTSITGECDVAMATFTITAARLRCQNTTSKTGIQPCLPPTTPTILSQHGCCAHFGTPFTSDSIGAIVVKPEMPSILSALASTQILNIMSLCVIAIVLFAHLVWIFERYENSEQFPTVRRRLDRWFVENL